MLHKPDFDNLLAVLAREKPSRPTLFDFSISKAAGRLVGDEARGRGPQLILDAFKEGGYASGTGNSVPDYIPYDNYIAMLDTARYAKAAVTVHAP